MLTEEFVLSYAQDPETYLSEISEKYKGKWEKKINQVEFNQGQIDFLESNQLLINIVIFSAEWCPDCQASVPVPIKMAEHSDYINVKIIDKDKHGEEVLEDYKTNGGKRVPLILFLNEDYQELSRWIERSTFGYKLVFEAKKEAVNSDRSYKEFVREKFKSHSKKLVNENIEELFDILEKSVMLLGASAKIDEIELIAK